MERRKSFNPYTNRFKTPMGSNVIKGKRIMFDHIQVHNDLKPFKRYNINKEKSKQAFSVFNKWKTLD
jgi:hypothetical protein